MDSGPATFEIIKTLPRRSQVALGAVAIEHLLDLYRLGNMKYTAADVPALPASVPRDRDLIELGLELAWRWVLEGKDDPAVRGPLVAMLEARPYLKESDTFSVASNGPIYGVIDTLTAIDAPDYYAAGRATSRSRLGVSYLARSLAQDEDAPAREQEREAEWQLKVATSLRRHGDAPIDRSMFTALLAEQLPWREYLDAYRLKWSGGSPEAVDAALPPSARAPKPPEKKAKIGKGGGKKK